MATVAPSPPPPARRVAGQTQVFLFHHGGKSSSGLPPLGEPTTVVVVMLRGIRCQAIPALNAHAIRSVGRAIRPRSLHDKVCPSWASGEPRVRLLNEGTLGRGVNPSETTVHALG
jgi:hypothetical protein